MLHYPSQYRKVDIRIFRRIRKMKKFTQIILFMSVLICLANSAYADCSTGYACSIKDLENRESLEQEQYLIEFVSVMNKYFDKKVEEPIFLNKKNMISSYQDLFIFNTIV